MEIKDKFGDFLRKLRKARGFKAQKDFAEATGISQASISRIENNTQIPEPDTLKIFAKVLDFSYADLMVRAGYWDEEDLLGEQLEETKKPQKINEDKRNDIMFDAFNFNIFEQANQFILSLNDENLLKKYTLVLDGKTLTEEEAKGVIAYLRALRSLEKKRK